MASRRGVSRKTITGNISEVQRRLKYLESKPSPSKIGSQAVLRNNLQPRAVGTDQLALRAVVNSTIEDDAINAAKLAADSVGNSELDNNAVDSDNYIDRSIDPEHYAIGSVDSNAVGGNAINNEEMADNAIDSPEYVDRSIDPEHYAIGSVDSTAVGGNAINNEEMNDESINSPEYVDGSIDPEHFAPGAVNSTAIDDNAVGATELGPNSVDSDAVIANSIHGSADSPDKVHIAPESIGENDIASNAIGFDELQGNSVDTIHLRENAVTGVEIGTKVIEGSLGGKNNIADNSIGQLNIGPNAVGTGELRDLNVTNAKIANGTITQGKFASSVSFPPADYSVTFLKMAIGAPEDIVFNSSTAGTYLSIQRLSGPGANILFNARTGTTASTLAVGNHTHSAGFQPSSMRFKTLVEEYDSSDVEKILNLRPVKYKYKAHYRELQHGDENSHRPWMLGYFAEEAVEAGVEEVIGYNSDGVPSSLRYDLLTVMAIELLKKHQNEIQSLKEEIKRLKEEK